MVSTQPALLCLACHSDLATVIENVFDTRFGIERAYQIARCRHCGLEQTSPLPEQEELKDLYERFYNFGGERGTAYTRLRERFLSSRLYRWWLAIDGDISFHTLRGSGRLLDVGCNEGRGLRLYRQNGFEAEGLELNDAAAEVARRQGFTVHSQLIEDFQPPHRYDVVVLSNVLEHSVSPQDMLAHVNRLLKPGGGLCVSCPNNRSWLRSLFGTRWINWHVPFHITHFSPETLRRMIEAAGFMQVQVKHRTPALWVAHSLIAGLFAKPSQVTRQLRSPLLVAALILAIRGLFFPVLWLTNRLGSGDCLLASARKE